MASSPYERIYVRGSIGISPANMLTPKKMVEEHLALGLLKYHRKFEGVLLAYNKVKVQMRGQIQWDLTHIVTHYTFEGLIFRPKIGDILTGRVDNLNKNHLGLKAQGIIPTSIPAHALPNNYIFDEEQHIWKEKGGGEDAKKIEYEDSAYFRIDIINTANGILTLIGTYMLEEELEKDHGLIPAINGGVTSAFDNNSNNNNNNDDDVLDMPEGFYPGGNDDDSSDDDNEGDDNSTSTNSTMIGMKRKTPDDDDDNNNNEKQNKKKKSSKKKHKKDKKKKKKSKKKKKDD